MRSQARLFGFGASLVVFVGGGCGFSPGRHGSESDGAVGYDDGSSGAAGGGGSVATGGGGATGTTGGGGTTASGGSTGATGTGGSSSTSCNAAGPRCNNCVDDDGDGLIDALDPECIGPLDNDEATFATGIPGDNLDPCKQDCFFDGDSGGGNDGCAWNLKCDPASPGSSLPKSCPYDANYRNCPGTQSDLCLSTCRTVTPNGCDCFGCCLVPGAPNPVYLAATCTATTFGDPAKCPPCTQVTACLNPCEHCEICVGKPTLPADCSVPPPPTGAGGSGGTTGSPCSGNPYCGPGGLDPLSCPAGTYCITGCCIPGIP